MDTIKTAAQIMWLLKGLTVTVG